MNWNPLYPGDGQGSPLEEAIKEAEWEDEMRRAEQELVEDEDGDEIL